MGFVLVIEGRLGGVLLWGFGRLFGRLLLCWLFVCILFGCLFLSIVNLTDFVWYLLIFWYLGRIGSW